MDSTKPVRNFIQFLWPSMLTMIMLAVYTFADTFVVGQRLGSTALGAMGICTPVLTITYAFGFLFGMGGASHYALSMGRGQKKIAREYFSTAVCLPLLSGAAAAVVLNLAARPFALFLGADSENLPYVMPYLRVLLCYIPGFMMDVLMMSFMKNEGHPTIAMIATATGSGLNVVLDFVFVFGLDMGMFGAAFATELCSGIGLLINLSFAAALHMNLRLEKPTWHGGIARKILSNGFSILILEASSGIVTFVYIHSAQRLYGEIGAGVYTIIMNWSLIFTNLTMGIAQAMQPLVSYSCGKGDRSMMKRYLSYALICAVILGAFDMMISFAAARPMSGVFADDNPEVVATATGAFRLYLPAFFLMAFGISIGYYFEAAARAGEATVIMLLRGMVLPVIFALLLPFLFGKNGLWLAVPASEAVTSAVAIALIRKRNRRSDSAVSSPVSEAH